MKIILTERQYKIILESVSNNEEIKQGAAGDPYQYKKVKSSDGIKYFYAKKGNNDWVEQTKQVGIDAIRNLIFPEDSNQPTSISKETKTDSKETSPTTTPTNTTTTTTSKETSPTKTTTTSKSPSSGKYDAIFVGGLEDAINQNGQLGILKNGLGEKNIASFKYNSSTSEINKVLESNPKIPIFLFSAGCTKAKDLVSNKNVDLNKLYIIEPYGVWKVAADIVKFAVASGVPPQNVFYHTVRDSKGKEIQGASLPYGKGLVDNATDTNAKDHFDALRVVGALKSGIV